MGIVAASSSQQEYNHLGDKRDSVRVGYRQFAMPEIPKKPSLVPYLENEEVDKRGAGPPRYIKKKELG